MTKISLQHIYKKFTLAHNVSVLNKLHSRFSRSGSKKSVQVLEDISAEVKAGEIVGIIGSNGSGKSTVLRIIAGIYKADAGKVEAYGRVVSIINLGVGLKERLTMRENIFLVGSLFGMSQKDIRQSFESIVHFSGLEAFTDTKIHQFSAGMIQRLAFSIAIHTHPDILLLDEVFEVGDEDFRQKSGDKILELTSQGLAVILVSHDLDLIHKYCHRVLKMDQGKLINEYRPNKTSLPH